MDSAAQQILGFCKLNCNTLGEFLRGGKPARANAYFVVTELIGASAIHCPACSRDLFYLFIRDHFSRIHIIGFRVLENSQLIEGCPAIAEACDIELDIAPLCLCHLGIHGTIYFGIVGQVYGCRPVLPVIRQLNRIIAHNVSFFPKDLETGQGVSLSKVYHEPLGEAAAVCAPSGALVVIYAVYAFIASLL